MTDHSKENTFVITIPCPKCGGDNHWYLLQTLATCEYCQSALWWPHPEGRPDLLVASDQVRGEEDLLSILGTYDAMHVRANMTPPESQNQEINIMGSDQYALSLPSVESLRRKRRHLHRLHEAHCVYVPYILFSASLAFHALGRTYSSAKKSYRTFFFLLEDMLPLYPPEWNFRDRGLWMSAQRLQPLTLELMSQRCFIEPEEMEVDAKEVTKKWLRLRMLLKPDIRPVAFESRILTSHQWVVFRPFYFVHATTPLRHHWFLIDGQFGTIAGYPNQYEMEAAKSLQACGLNPEKLRPTEIQLLSCRCPVCGWDLTLKSEGTMQICLNCGRLLTPEGTGFSASEYYTIDPENLPWWPKRRRVRPVWLPFWRVEATWQYEERTYESCHDLLLDFLPPLKVIRNLVPERMSPLYLPAFDVRHFDGYDEWAFASSAALTFSAPETSRARLFTDIPMKDTGDIIFPSIEADLFEPILGNLIFDYLSGMLKMRLNTALLRKMHDIKMVTGERELVYVPIPMGNVGANPDQIIGPKSSEDWFPLRDGIWPPGIQRTVRRWKDRAREGDHTHRLGK